MSIDFSVGMDFTARINCLTSSSVKLYSFVMLPSDCNFPNKEISKCLKRYNHIFLHLSRSTSIIISNIDGTSFLFKRLVSSSYLSVIWSCY